MFFVFMNPCLWKYWFSSSCWNYSVELFSKSHLCFCFLVVTEMLWFIHFISQLVLSLNFLLPICHSKITLCICFGLRCSFWHLFSRYCCGHWQQFINVSSCNKHPIFLFQFFPDSVGLTCKSVTGPLWHVLCVILAVSDSRGEKKKEYFTQVQTLFLTTHLVREGLLPLSLPFSLGLHGYDSVIAATHCITLQTNPTNSFNFTSSVIG